MTSEPLFDGLSFDAPNFSVSLTHFHSLLSPLRQTPLLRLSAIHTSFRVADISENKFQIIDKTSISDVKN